MECEESCIAEACTLWPVSVSGNQPKTLNEDPYNVRAEELALWDCEQGFVVDKELNEVDLVATSCGSVIPGTPDGGFIDANGLLHLVQVVRVPLMEGMDADAVGDALYDTVLTKVVKSQTWMRATRTLPHEFIIFCWLPPRGAYRECLQQSDSLLWAEALITNVRSGGWPFTLRVKAPEQADLLFPACFGLGSERRTMKKDFHDLHYFLNAEEFQELEDDEAFTDWNLFDEELEAQSDNANEDSVGFHEAGFWAALAIEFIESQTLAEEQEILYVFDVPFIEDDFGKIRRESLDAFVQRRAQTKPVPLRSSRPRDDSVLPSFCVAKDIAILHSAYSGWSYPRYRDEVEECGRERLGGYGHMEDPEGNQRLRGISTMGTTQSLQMRCAIGNVIDGVTMRTRPMRLKSPRPRKDSSLPTLLHGRPWWGLDRKAAASLQARPATSLWKFDSL